MDYIDMVNQIVNAEHSAREIAREAEEKEAALDADLEREIAEMKAGYYARARERIAQLELDESGAEQRAIAGLNRRRDDAMSAVENACSKYQDNWVATLLEMIVGGAP